ncbi:hypothetical protein [Gilvibacter sp.]|jgi:hypothetical protein|uniref:hypothetical protein n=1 Tax=Gilvibacter sp. TaxID=2729997 RepID=UPI003B51B035
MSYSIKVGLPDYQTIFEDNEVIILARFFWSQLNNADVHKGHFRLVNKNFHGLKYKIHSAIYCNQHRQLELRLSSHANFGDTNNIKDQVLTGMKLGLGDQEDYWFRISKDSLVCTRDECKKPGTVGGSPDDKEGSILIGTQ